MQHVAVLLVLKARQEGIIFANPQCTLLVLHQTKKAMIAKARKAALGVMETLRRLLLACKTSC